MIDIDRVRHDTPGCSEVVHFNNAGSSLPTISSVDAIIQYLELEARSGGYEAAALREDALEHTYDAAAQLINADRNEIAMIENATRAWDMAFYSIDFQSGDRILTSMAEYASNFIPYLQMQRRHGVSVEAVPNDEYGQLSVDKLREMIDERVKLISITHVPTNGGLVNPAAAIGNVAREADILYLIDACQSVGQLPVDVEEIGCDMLSTTGRKYLRGPRGTGFLYVRKDRIEQLEPPFLDLHAARWTGPESYETRTDARRFENWETYFAGKVGLGVAIDYALELGIDAIWERIQYLAERLRAELAELPGIQVHDLGQVRCGIVTFTSESHEAEFIKKRLAKERINVTVSGTTSTRLDMDARHLEQLVRASVHYYNTDEEIDRFLSVLEGIS